MPELSSTPWTEADARWLRAQDADDAEFFAHHRKCRHCGKPPEADGDHSCPCPYRDDNCPDHPTSDAHTEQKGTGA